MPAPLSSPAPRLTPPEGWWQQAFTLQPSHSELGGHPCGARQMLTLLAYDIADPKRLAKVAKLCEDYGVRVQYSVFELRLEPDQFDTLWLRLLELIDPAHDRVTAYKICAACAKTIHDGGIQQHYARQIAYVF